MSAVQFRPPAPRPSGSGTGGRQAERLRDVGSSGLWPPRPRTARRFASAIETPSRACGALRRVPIGSSCFCERGGAPLSHFPPGQAGSEPEVRCHCFYGTPVADCEKARGRLGTPTSGRHAARSAARRRIAPLFHDTPGRERRPPVGTAARSAARRRIAPLFHDTPGRERRPPVGTAARSAARRRVPRSRPDDAEHRGPSREGTTSDLGVLLCRPPAAGCAGPHRENCPEVGVPLPARRSAWWHGRRDVHHQELNFLARRGVQEDAIMSVSPGGGRRRCV